MGEVLLSSRRYPIIEDLRDICARNWEPPLRPYDEVYPNIFIGDGNTALCIRLLRNEGISYVLNSSSPCASCLRKESCGTCVMTKSSYYQTNDITYLGLATIDERRFPLWRFFDESSNFIDEALMNGGLPLKRSARNIAILKGLGITHILNPAQGKDVSRYVDTSEKYYKKSGLKVKFLGFSAMDIVNFQLSPYFDISNEFIEDALSTSGKILVHCKEGISRSATLVIAFLMMKRKMSAKDAISLVRGKRQIYPNDGFLQQLCDLDIRLRSQRT